MEREQAPTVEWLLSYRADAQHAFALASAKTTFLSNEERESHEAAVASMAEKLTCSGLQLWLCARTDEVRRIRIHAEIRFERDSERQPPR